MEKVGKVGKGETLGAKQARKHAVPQRGAGKYGT